MYTLFRHLFKVALAENNPTSTKSGINYLKRNHTFTQLRCTNGPTTQSEPRGYSLVTDHILFRKTRTNLTPSKIDA